MAERRMFAKTIIDSDAFLDMPITARLLYYDLGMRADDDGFVNSPKKIMRMIGASMDDINILIAKKFVIPFDNGVVVIKHWKINNYIQSDRYNETKYTEQKALLTADDKGIYHLNPDLMYTTCIHDGYMMDTQVRLGKDSIGEDSINTITIAQKSAEDEQLQKRFDAFWDAYGNKKGKKNAFKAFRKINPDEELFQKIMQGIEKYHASRKWREGYRKEPTTWLNGECWNDEYDDESVVNSNQVNRGNHTRDSCQPRTAYDLKPRFAGHQYDADGNDITGQQPD